jgi:hypothetical protein
MNGLLIFDTNLNFSILIDRISTVAFHFGDIFNINSSITEIQFLTLQSCLLWSYFIATSDVYCTLILKHKFWLFGWLLIHFLVPLFVLLRNNMLWRGTNYSRLSWLNFLIIRLTNFLCLFSVSCLWNLLMSTFFFIKFD